VVVASAGQHANNLHPVASKPGDEGIDPPVLNLGDNPPPLSGKSACKITLRGR